MVELHPPPPQRPVSPIFLTIPKGEKLVRIFDPNRRDATALTFRANGPRKRFDHHRGNGEDHFPCDDPNRAVYYASRSPQLSEAFSSCLVEVFGDSGVVTLDDLCVAMPTATQSLTLLDLRDRGAMHAGTVAAIAKCDHRRSQPWSRFFYENTADFDAIDGLVYRNAHNDEPAIMLYERAQQALACPRSDVIRLDHPGLRSLLIATMQRNNLSF